MNITIFDLQKMTARQIAMFAASNTETDTNKLTYSTPVQSNSEISLKTP